MPRMNAVTEEMSGQEKALNNESLDQKMSTKSEKYIYASKESDDVKTIKVTVPKDKIKTRAVRDAEERAKEQHIPPKPGVRYTDDDLEEFREAIADAREEALDELSMLKERLDDLTNYDSAEESMIYSMHMAEQGSEAMEKEKTYAQIQRINEYIKKLDEAVQRIDEKTYGICRVCGCLIARERLMAVPITTLSASYKIHKKCPEDGTDRIEPVRR